MRKLIIGIIILSIFDAVATAAGVASGEVVEANAVLAGAVMSSPWLACGIVCAGVCGLMLLVLRLYQTHNKPRWVPYALSLVLVERVAIAAMHVVGLAAL